jgi:hypothetical protein
MFIYWKQEQPKTLAACQVIMLGVPPIELYQSQFLEAQPGEGYRHEHQALDRVG